MAKRILVGRVAVDSGQVIICDPCYLIDNFDEASYEEVCKAKRDAGFGEFYAKDFATAVVSSTLVGDGLYPVFAKLDHDGNGVAKLEIDFTRMAVSDLEAL